MVLCQSFVKYYIQRSIDIKINSTPKSCSSNDQILNTADKSHTLVLLNQIRLLCSEHFRIEFIWKMASYIYMHISVRLELHVSRSQITCRWSHPFSGGQISLIRNKDSFRIKVLHAWNESSEKCKCYLWTELSRKIQPIQQRSIWKFQALRPFHHTVQIELLLSLLP